MFLKRLQSNYSHVPQVTGAEFLPGGRRKPGGQVWVSLKATGYPQAEHLAHGLQSFENEAKKMSMRMVAQQCLGVWS